MGARARGGAQRRRCGLAGPLRLHQVGPEDTRALRAVAGFGARACSAQRPPFSPRYMRALCACHEGAVAGREGGYRASVTTVRMRARVL